MFGTKHFIGLLMMGAIVACFFIVTTLFVNKKGEKVIKITLRCIVIALFVVEFTKFIYLLKHRGYIGVDKFPFTFCSMALYLYPMVAFGDEKVVEFFKPASFIVGLFGGTLTLLLPKNVIKVSMPWFENFGFNLPMFSFLYHTIMLIFALYMVNSKFYTLKAKDFLKAIGVILPLALIAVIFNSILPEADFFMLGHGYGFPLNKLITLTNQFVYVVTMLSIFVFGTFLVYLVPIIKHLKEKHNKTK